MGLAVANLRGFDLPARRPFFETLVQLIIGVLFVSISATVTPQSASPSGRPALGVWSRSWCWSLRPLVAVVSTPAPN